MNSLRYILKEDYRRIYPNKIGFLKIIKLIYTNDITYKKWKYIKYMRICDALDYKSNLYDKIKKLYYQRKKNKLGLLFGYEIGSKNIGPGLCLYHNGPIVINGNSIIGNNCSLHGDNCIGNDGIDDNCPIIGNNVEIGVGAKIIGKVVIEDDVIIGAGCVVVSDIKEKGSVVVGVPGSIIKKR